MRLLNRSAGRLSRHRRGPLASLLVIIAGLLLTGGIFTAVVNTTAQADETSSNADLVTQGRDLFLVSCAFCHGQNGEGIRTEDGNQIGPPLVGVGAAAVSFQVGTGRMPMVQPGAQVPSKPTSFDDDEVAALAAYVASLGPGPAIPDESDYSVEGLSDDERQAAIVRGGQIFLTNCTACHNFQGTGGAMPRGGYAPSLSETSAQHIYEAMLTGPQNMPTFSNGNLTPDEKRDVIAYLYSLREMPNYGGFGLDGGPVTEGLVAWLLGIGLLVGAAVWIAAHTTRTSKKKKVEA